MLHTDYHTVYTTSYYDHSDGRWQWENNKLRYGDMLACIAYVLGYKSFDDLLKQFGHNDDYEDLRKDYLVRNFDKREPYFGDLNAKQQLDKLKENQTRQPKSVVDIGSGRGELPASLAYLGIKCQSVEPIVDAAMWSEKTLKNFFGLDKTAVKLINLTAPECLDQLDLSDVDTVTFCESIEHIPENCFNPLWEKLKEALCRNNGMLVIVNWICGHPIRAENKEHCRTIDDNVFNELSEGGNTVFRLGSHLVVQY